MANITIGRRDGGNCDILIDDEYVSTHHASLIWYSGMWILRPEATTNGTYVNDVKLWKPHQIHSNDIFRFGRTLCTGSELLQMAFSVIEARNITEKKNGS